MPSRLLILSLSSLILLGFPTLCSSEAFYKWVDENGRVHYSSQKPDNNPSVKTINIKEDYTGAKKSPQQMPDLNQAYATEKSQLTSVLPSDKGSGAGTVVMYSTAWCGYCKKARLYFRENNIAFTDYDIEKSTKAKAQHKQYNGSGVPLLLFGKHKMQGFSVEGFERLYYQ